MNKRQRKKHRIGEFDEVGFDLQCQMPAKFHGKVGSEANKLLDEFYDKFFEFLESLDLQSGGGLGYDWNLGVFPNSTRIITEENRLAVVKFLEENGVEFIQTYYCFGWACRPLTKSELHNHKLPMEQPVKVPVKIILSAENYDKVMKIIDEPSEPNEALMEAARRYKEDVAAGRITPLTENQIISQNIDRLRELGDMPVDLDELVKDLEKQQEDMKGI